MLTLEPRAADTWASSAIAEETRVLNECMCCQPWLAEAFLTFKATQFDEVLEHQPTDVDGPAGWGVVHGAVVCYNLIVQHRGALSPACIEKAGAHRCCSTLCKRLAREAFADRICSCRQHLSSTCQAVVPPLPRQHNVSTGQSRQLLQEKSQPKSHVVEVSVATCLAGLLQLWC